MTAWQLPQTATMFHPRVTMLNCCILRTTFDLYNASSAATSAREACTALIVALLKPTLSSIRNKAACSLSALDNAII
jgi:hypothetical protein